MIRILPGDCIEVLRSLDADSIHACLTDPPYGLEFMGKEWDGAGGFRRSLSQADVGRKNDFGRLSQRGPEYRATPLYQSWCEAWAREVYRALRPGAYLMAFGGTRTYHRLACAIEDAGFEIRDQFAWMYSSGFPKSRDASKAIDQELGAKRQTVGRAKGKSGENLNLLARPNGADNPEARGMGAYGQGAKQTTVDIAITAPATLEAAQWQGFGTAVKPAWEPLVLARKPVIGNLAQNLLKYGTGALNIDGCRVQIDNYDPKHVQRQHSNRQTWEGGVASGFAADHVQPMYHPKGRWPANVAHDGSEEVEVAFAAFGPAPGQQGDLVGHARNRPTKTCFGDMGPAADHMKRGDTGSASRFFYTAKADKGDRADSRHPTVKPVDLIRHYVRLITPPGGTVLDCFAGSGTTGEAAMLEKLDCILIERDPKSVTDIEHRIKRWSGLDGPLFAG